MQSVLEQTEVVSIAHRDFPLSIAYSLRGAPPLLRHYIYTVPPFIAYHFLLRPVYLIPFFSLGA